MAALVARKCSVRPKKSQGAPNTNHQPTAPVGSMVATLVKLTMEKLVVAQKCFAKLKLIQNALTTLINQSILFEEGKIYSK